MEASAAAAMLPPQQQQQAVAAAALLQGAAASAYGLPGTLPGTLSGPLPGTLPSTLPAGLPNGAANGPMGFPGAANGAVAVGAGGFPLAAASPFAVAAQNSMGFAMQGGGLAAQFPYAPFGLQHAGLQHPAAAFAVQQAMQAGAFPPMYDPRALAALGVQLPRAPGGPGGAAMDATGAGGDMYGGDPYGQGGDDDARALKRPRLVWTPQLHRRFEEAVQALGVDKAVPKSIMQVRGGTCAHVVCCCQLCWFCAVFVVRCCWDLVSCFQREPRAADKHRTALNLRDTCVQRCA